MLPAMAVALLRIISYITILLGQCHFFNGLCFFFDLILLWLERKCVVITGSEFSIPCGQVLLLDIFMKLPLKSVEVACVSKDCMFLVKGVSKVHIFNPE